jgi:hypothetical protein
MDLHDEIATIVHELFEARGCICGHDLIYMKGALAL